jgi:hypothetical protein
MRWRVPVGVGSSLVLLQGAQLAKVSQAGLAGGTWTLAAFAQTWYANIAGSGGGIGSQTLVVEKKERFVLPDRPADGAAKVVPLQRGDRGTARIIEPIVGVQNRVAEEFVGAAVKLVASGAGDHIDDGAASKAVFRGEVGLLDLEFLD